MYVAVRYVTIVLHCLQGRDLSFVPYDEPDAAYTEVTNFIADLSISKTKLPSQLAVMMYVLIQYNSWDFLSDMWLAKCGQNCGFLYWLLLQQGSDCRS